MADDKNNGSQNANFDLTKSFTHTNQDIPGNPPSSRPSSQSSSQSQASQSSQSQQQSNSSNNSD